MRSLRSMSMIGFPMGLILVPLGVPAAAIAFGERWTDAGYAAMTLAGVTVAGTLISFASETLKAAGRPNILTRIRVVNLVAAVVFMIVLLPFDLVGVCGGLSIGTAIGGVYAMVKVAELLEVSGRRILQEVVPSAAAAIFMAGVLTPVEFLIVDARSHGTAVGLGLLALEALLGVVLYFSALRVLSPDGFHELVSTLGQLLRRGRSEPEAEAGTESAEAPDEQAPTEASLP
jgi:O-antigen/teichoic acid export membrane protein